MATSVNVNGIEFQPRLLINGEVGYSRLVIAQ